MKQIRWDEHPFIRFQKNLHILMTTEQGQVVKTKLPEFNSGRGTSAPKTEVKVVYNRDYVVAKLHHVLKPILGLDASDIHDLLTEAIKLEENVET